MSDSEGAERDEQPVVVTGRLLRDWPLPTADDGAGKAGRGTVVVIGGGHTTPGAVLLAGVAALRVGAGRLVMATVEHTATALAVTVPEAGVVPLPATPGGGLGAAAVDAAGELVSDADAVVLGPGMSGAEDARELVGGILPKIRDGATLVVDAMALTCGAVDAAVGRRLAGRLVATPNRTEAGYLLDDEDVAATPRTTRRLAAQLAGVVALQSCVATAGGHAWSDGSGNRGLGTSGSGDVLAGAIAGLAARGAAPEQAAVWGVHLHGEAGERLAARVGAVGYLARELLDELPMVLDQLAR